MWWYGSAHPHNMLHNCSWNLVHTQHFKSPSLILSKSPPCVIPAKPGVNDDCMSPGIQVMYLWNLVPTTHSLHRYMPSLNPLHVLSCQAWCERWLNKQWNTALKWNTPGLWVAWLKCSSFPFRQNFKGTLKTCNFKILQVTRWIFF